MTIMASKFLSTPSARRATPPFLSTRTRCTHFYPRPPRGGRRRSGSCRSPSQKISIHALREEGDIAGASAGISSAISIHALREEGDAFHHPAAPTFHPISIHALREEGDSVSASSTSTAPQNFYPRPPRGGRRGPPRSSTRSIWNFYPRPPRGGRPAIYDGKKLFSAISIHALREEGDRLKPPITA